MTMAAVGDGYLLHNEAPPSYDSIFGPELNLGHIDFWPRNRNGEIKCKRADLEDFGSLVVRANEWLHAKSEYQIAACQTIWKKVYTTNEIYTLNTFYKCRQNSACRVYGLRLFLRQCRGGRPQVLAFSDLVPARVSAARTLGFEPLNVIIDRFNAMQTTMPLGGVADFLPEQIGDTGLLDRNPSYQCMSAVVEKAAKWTREARNIRVVSLQTLDTKYWKKSELGGRRLDTMNMFEMETHLRYRILFLRMAYMKVAGNEHRPDISKLSYVTFHPQVEVSSGCCGGGEKRYEDMEMIQQRIRNWFAKQRECRLVSIDTTMVPSGLAKRCGQGKEVSTFYGFWYLTNDDNSTPARHNLLPIIRIFVDGHITSYPRHQDAVSDCVIM